MPVTRTLSMTAVSALAAVHQPLPPKSLVFRSKDIIRAVAAAVRRSPAFQVVRAHGVHAIEPPAGWPQARNAPTPWVFQSSTLYIWVRQPPCPDGTVVLPRRLPSLQVRPPSIERSSHTWSPAPPLSIEPQPIASVSSKCSAIERPDSVAVTGTRSCGLSPGSRASQYLLHTVAAEATPPVRPKDNVVISSERRAG